MMTRRGFLEAGLAASAAAQAATGRIRVGFVGAGARSHELMTAVQQHKDVEIAGVVDAYTGRVERAVERTGAKPYKDHRELFADRSLDAVVIATPDHWHRQMILEAIAAGKDVYSEKPLTYTVEQGKEIIRAAAEAKRMVQVGSQVMSSEIPIKAKELIKSGKLGKVTYIRACYNRNSASGAWLYPIPPDASPKTVNWQMFLGPAQSRPFSLDRFFRWRCFRDYSGGIATDLFVHLCTTIHFLMDAAMPSVVMAMGQQYRWKENREVPDTMNALLEYPEGFAVSLGSTFNNELPSENGFHILGTEGSINLGWNSLTFTPENPREDNKWIVESWPRKLEEAYFRDPKVIASELTPRKQREPELIKPREGDSTVAHFRHFFDSVRSRKPYWQDAMRGHHAAACAHMINQSAEQMRAVRWDFTQNSVQV